LLILLQQRKLCKNGTNLHQVLYLSPAFSVLHRIPLSLSLKEACKHDGTNEWMDRNRTTG